MHLTLPMSRSLLYALAALVVIAFIWAYLTPIDIAVRARGVVRPEGDPVRIITEVGGRIRRVYVREGSEVHTGDPILQFDDRELSLKKRSIETRIHFTELHLADLERQRGDMATIEEQSASLDEFEHKAAARTVRTNLESARTRFQRAEQLLQEGLIARQAHDEARLALAQAEVEESKISTKSSALKRAQAEAHLRDLAAQTTPIRADLASLYTQLDQTRLELDRLIIISPVDAQITSLASLHPDEIISSGAAVAALVPRSHFLVIESWLPASERSYVDPGQRVRLRTDSLPSDQYNAFDGAVLSISPDARFNDSLTGAYRVLITPASYSPPLRLGMTFDVHFITRQDRLLGLLFQRIRKPFS